MEYGEHLQIVKKKKSPHQKHFVLYNKYDKYKVVIGLYFHIKMGPE